MAVKLVPHHDSSQLKKRYQSCPDPVEKTHWWIIWKISRAENSVTHIAQEAGVGRPWVYKLKDRYNAQGEAGLRDHRQDNGIEPIMDEIQVVALRKALSQPPPRMRDCVAVRRWPAGWKEFCNDRLCPKWAGNI